MEDDIQHQIPQQISAYQFRLVGDMTLQQFFQVAGGAIVSIIIYSSNLPGYIKWPLVLISFLIGVAFAFFPLEDRPLQKWVLLYFKAIYSPTLFVWRQNQENFDYFQKEELTLPESESNTINNQQSTPPATSDPATVPIPHLEKQEQKILENSRVITDQTTDGIKVQTTVQPILPEINQEEMQQKRTVEVPRNDLIKVEQQEPEQKSVTQIEVTDNAGSEITPIAAQKTPGTAKQAQFNQDAGPPASPTTPNIVVGQVLGADGEIVENAILEIRDTEGRPVRALKSNRLGHFMIVTALSNGNYEMITEKEGLNFDKITFEAKGEVIPPIAIWANNSKAQAQQTINKDQRLIDSEKTIYSQGEKG